MTMLFQLLSASQVKVEPDSQADPLTDAATGTSSSLHKQHPCINCGKVFSQKLHLQVRLLSSYELQLSRDILEPARDVITPSDVTTPRDVMKLAYCNNHSYFSDT